MNDSLKNFEWFSGYEWTMFNPVDRHFQTSFLGLHKGDVATLVCRSPWVDADLKHMPPATRCAIGVNHAVKDHPFLNYVVGSDETFFRDCSPLDHPGVTFITGFSENRAKMLAEMGYPANVVPYSSPPVLPCGLLAPTRDYPRPRTGHGHLSSITGLWLAWYMGCSRLYIAGAHFKLSGDRYHGGYQSDPATGFTRQQVIERYRCFLPQQALQFIGSVEALRDKGLHIDWPGEEVARSVNAEVIGA